MFLAISSRPASQGFPEKLFSADTRDQTMQDAPNDKAKSPFILRSMYLRVGGRLSL